MKRRRTREILKGHFLLQYLPVETLDNISRYARLQKFAKGDVIVRKGTVGTGMMAVVEGRVKISAVSPDGKEVILDFINPGEVFGEIALLDNRERTADATAMETCQILVLERRDFLPFLERHPQTCIKLLSVFCGRLRQTNQLIEDSLFLNVESRFAKRLLGFARQYGEPRPDGILIRLKLSPARDGGADRCHPGKRQQAAQRLAGARLGQGKPGRHPGHRPKGAGIGGGPRPLEDVSITWTRPRPTRTKFSINGVSTSVSVPQDVVVLEILLYPGKSGML